MKPVDLNELQQEVLRRLGQQTAANTGTPRDHLATALRTEPERVDAALARLTELGYVNQSALPGQEPQWCLTVPGTARLRQVTEEREQANKGPSAIGCGYIASYVIFYFVFQGLVSATRSYVLAILILLPFFVIMALIGRLLFRKRQRIWLERDKTLPDARKPLR